MHVREIDDNGIYQPAVSIDSETTIDSSTDSGSVIAEIEHMLPVDFVADIHSGLALVTHDRDEIIVGYRYED